MTAVPVLADPLLRHELEQPHEAALAALRTPDAGSLAAVTWSSTHLAAVGRVLHPLAAARLPHGDPRLRAAVAADHALLDALWWLDRRLTGDRRAAGHRLEACEEAVAAGLEHHARLESALVAALLPDLTVEDQRALADRLARAVRHAPTRPHPDAPVHGPVSAVAFAVDAGADHLRDLLDSRGWPTPHDEAAARPLSRWGAYLMGAPFPRERPPDR